MLAHPARSVFLLGALASIAALSIDVAVSQALDSWPGYEPAQAGSVLEVAQGFAQGFGRPPAEIAGDGPYGLAQSDGAGLLVRIDRLENQVRQLTGQIEQMQFATRKLEEQLRKFQEDVEFRFQEGGGHGGAPAPQAPKLQRRSEIELPADTLDDDPVIGSEGAAEIKPKSAARRSDAFDPASDPTAPGAPRPLGSPAQASVARAPRSAALRAGADDGEPDAPLDLSGSKLAANKDPSTSREPGSDPLSRPVSAVQPRLTDPTGSEAGSMPARTAATPAREEFDLALGLLKQKEYESAEKSFTAFLQKNPKSRLASDALYFLGESYFQRGRQREAAEQYLKVSTSYASSPRAPDAFLRLGQSLNALGAKEQACAAYAEIERKYPNASASVKSGAEREAKRARC